MRDDPTLSYNAHFQNEPTASAPAVFVKVTEPVPTSVNPTSVQLTGFGFGKGTSYVAPAHRQSISAVEPSGDSEGDVVDVTGTYDRPTSVITWTFTTVNPGTGDADYNATAGFLPPDNATGVGEAYVSFTAQAKSSLATGSKIQAQASVVFTTNAAIDTPVWSNSIDNTTPTATVHPLSSTSPPGNLAVDWSGTDGAGSGITSYDVYVSVDGGPLTLWQNATAATSGTYAVTAGHTYGFAAAATSLVGLSSATPTAAQTTTRVVAKTTPVPSPTVTSVTPSSGPTGGGTTVTLTGTHFTGATSVTFGTVLATSVHVTSATTITATTPARTVGAVTVSVTTTGGTGSKAGAFTYVAPSASGYDLVGSDGGVFVFAPPGTSGGFYGSLPQLGVTPAAPIVGMVPTVTDKGYFLDGADGGVFSFGTAPFLGSLPGLGVSTDDITGIVAAATDKGYFLVGRDGGVFAFGTVPFLGSLPGIGVHVDDIIGIASTPSGNGYWLVAATGTVYAFGAAKQLGTWQGTTSPVAAIAGTPTGGGYWITTQAGGVKTFGNAHGFGTLPAKGVTPTLPVIGIVHTVGTGGYWLIGADGGIFAFGDAGFVGSLPGLSVSVTNIVGAVPTQS